jgi:hypothetical protein
LIRWLRESHLGGGNTCHLGGRMILCNTCLASLPTYTMGFYLLPKGTHKKMDGVRSKFF